MLIITSTLTVAVWHILQQSVKATNGKQRTASVTDYGIYSGHCNTFLLPLCVQSAWKGESAVFFSKIQVYQQNKGLLRYLLEGGGGGGGWGREGGIHSVFCAGADFAVVSKSSDSG